MRKTTPAKKTAAAARVRKSRGRAEKRQAKQSPSQRLVISTGNVNHFTPPDSDVTYHLATPSIITRRLYQSDALRLRTRAGREMGLDRAVRGYTPAEIRDGLLAFLKKSAGGDELKALNKIVRDVSKAVDRPTISAVSRAADKLPAGLADDFIEIQNVAQANDEAFASMCDEQTLVTELVLIAAARRFLVGWQGLDIECVRVNGLLAEDTLESLPQADLSYVAVEIFNSLQLTEGTAKNSR